MSPASVQVDKSEFTPALLAERLAECLSARPAQSPDPQRLWVGLSGGADSVALLHALGALRAELAPVEIRAAHVHHALHDQADAWEEVCRRLCAALELPLRVLRVDAGAGPGESPEAAARRVRYRALEELLEAGDVVCSAHHRRDQAETLLLQLVRGAGPAGLAGMPALAPLGRGWLARPLLGMRPERLRDYLRKEGLEWVEDPSNADEHFDRNYVRRQLLPLLERRWPGAERTLARAAAHQADAAALAEALARIDLAGAGGCEPGTLSSSALLALGPARARNLVRAWLAGRGLPTAAAAHVHSIVDELAAARDDATPLVTWPGAEVRRYRDALYALAPLPVHDASRVMAWNPASALELCHGSLESAAAEGRGLSAERCRRARLEVRFRRGGERFRPAGRRHSAALKKLLQTSDVPPWLRDRIPLIYVDGELAAVAGLWVGDGFGVGGRDSGWVVTWTELPGSSA